MTTWSLMKEMQILMMGKINHEFVKIGVLHSVKFNIIQELLSMSLIAYTISILSFHLSIINLCKKKAWGGGGSI